MLTTGACAKAIPTQATTTQTVMVTIKILFFIFILLSYFPFEFVVASGSGAGGCSQVSAAPTCSPTSLLLDRVLLDRGPFFIRVVVVDRFHDLGGLGSEIFLVHHAFAIHDEGHDTGLAIFQRAGDDGVGFHFSAIEVTFLAAFRFLALCG